MVYVPYQKNSPAAKRIYQFRQRPQKALKFSLCVGDRLWRVYPCSRITLQAENGVTHSKQLYESLERITNCHGDKIAVILHQRRPQISNECIHRTGYITAAGDDDDDDDDDEDDEDDNGDDDGDDDDCVDDYDDDDDGEEDYTEDDGEDEDDEDDGGIKDNDDECLPFLFGHESYIYGSQGI